MRPEEFTPLLFKSESYDIVGCAMKVHTELGNGFLEAVYQEALSIEFQKMGLPYIQEAEISIVYKGIPLSKKYFADFLCYNEIIVELKAVSELTENHYKQLFNYLKASHKKLGILINFGSQSLDYKRIVL